MSEPLERFIEEEVCKYAAVLGIVNIKLNLTANTGYPDRLFFIPGGMPLLIEFKRPGARLVARQKLVANVLTQLGYDVQMHDNVHTACRALDKALAEKEFRG